MKRLTLDEMLAKVKSLLGHDFWNPNMRYEQTDWFFPSDLIPHSSQFKYQCKKLYEAGLLERHGDGTNRWGYTYRIKQPSQGKEDK